MRYLVVRAPVEDSGEDSRGGTETPLPPEQLWLDRLCQGLLSRARHQGFLGRRPAKLAAAPVLCCPRHSPFDMVLIWNDEQKIDWKRVQLLGARAQDEVAVAGSVLDEEIREGRRLFAQLQKFTPSEPQLPAAYRDLSAQQSGAAVRATGANAT